MNRVGYFLRRPALLLSLLFILLVVMSALFAPWLTPFDPDEQFVEGLSLEGAPLSPNSTYWLGTDLLGRDLFSRLIYGARTSLLIGVVANGTAVLIGVLVGLSAGYLQGRIGGLLMRFTDLMMAFPALLLAIALAAIFQPSVWIVSLVIDPRDEAEFAPGHVLFFERNVVHALPTLLEEPVIFLSLASPRRDPEDITFVDPKDGTARTFMARNNESA